MIMETEKKRAGRPKKMDAKRNVFAFRFTDAQLSVIDWMISQLSEPNETKSECCSRLFTSFLATKLIEKQMKEKADFERVPLRLYFQQEKPFRQVKNQVLGKIAEIQRDAQNGAFREFRPDAVPRCDLREDPGIPLPDSALETLTVGASVGAADEGIPIQ